MEKLIKEKMMELRIYFSLGIIVMGFFPWVEVISKSEYSGAISESAQAGVTYNGYQAIQYSFLGLLIFLIPIAFILLEFLPQIKIKIGTVYLCGSMLGLIITVISMLLGKAAAASASASSTAGGIDLDVKTTANIKIGFWIILVLYIAIVIVTLVKDFAFNKAALSEKGIKGIMADVAQGVTDDLKDIKQITSESNIGASVSEKVSGAMNVTCPKCGANVLKGKKFCSKCGEKMPELVVEGKQTEKISLKSQKGVKVMTVKDYINSLKNIQCDKCEEFVPAGNKFCPNCGAAVAVKIIPEICQSCGKELIKGKKYCADCGKEVTLIELKTNCDKCNGELYFGKKFCVECGSKVQ